MTKPIASLSLDLDNKWSYMKTHGDAGWDSFPSYLDIVVPRFLEFLAQRDIKITVFVVGQDAALEKNHEALASIRAAGHEIGNHSFHHEPWLHLYSREQINDELARAEEHIERVTGELPVGFRGPGFSLSADVLRVLVDRGYQYDCSTFPTFLGPLARLYYFLTARLDEQQKKERKKLFGTMGEGFRPLRPYAWDLSGDEPRRSHVRQNVGLATDRPRSGERGYGECGYGNHLLEIPVTTMPWFKVPMHVSYLLYLDQFSRPLAMTYWRMALTLCRMSGVAPSLLLHPLDFLGRDDDRDLDFFPAMRSPSARKVELVGKVIDEMSRHYQIVPMREHAAAIVGQKAEVRSYSEGVASHRPGARATLGQELEPTKYPEGVSSSA
ncbi:MAG: polysaccharide deacetylase family protein [Planctomycetaceae bacterium]